MDKIPEKWLPVVAVHQALAVLGVDDGLVYVQPAKEGYVVLVVVLSRADIPKVKQGQGQEVSARLAGVVRFPGLHADVREYNETVIPAYNTLTPDERDALYQQWFMPMSPSVHLHVAEIATKINMEAKVN